MKKDCVKGIACIALILAMLILAAGCASTPKEPPVALGLTLEESLQRYMGPQEQNWGNKKVNVYFLDSLRFEEFKAELDAGGEYKEDGSWTEKNRDWSQGETFARWAVWPDGISELDLCKEDNSRAGYRYKKVPQASELKLEESLRKYVVPQEQTWDKGEKVTVYFLDPLHFEEFKVEIDAMDEYYQADSWTYTRDWEKGMTFARWAARADGTFELTLCKKNNSTPSYRYKKLPQVGDTWEEKWDEGMIKFTYLGLEDPGFIHDPGKDRGAGMYKGYYKMTYLDDGGRTVYIYYPETGRNAQYSNWLD
jgi:hypothetical protein